MTFFLLLFTLSAHDSLVSFIAVTKKINDCNQSYIPPASLETIVSYYTNERVSLRVQAPLCLFGFLEFLKVKWETELPVIRVFH